MDENLFHFAVTYEGDYGNAIFNVRMPAIPPIGTVLVHFTGVAPDYYEVHRVMLKAEPFTIASILDAAQRLDPESLKNTTSGWLIVTGLPVKFPMPPSPA